MNREAKRGFELNEQMIKLEEQKTMNIRIDESCKNCKTELKYLKFLHKKHKDFYANMNMKTYELLEGFVLSPDFNCSGYLTHFHLIKASKENLKGIVKRIEQSEEESKKIKDLKKLGLWKNLKYLNTPRGLKK